MSMKAELSDYLYGMAVGIFCVIFYLFVSLFN